MLRLEEFDGAIWEPACGDGAMSRELSKVRDKVISTDLIYRGCGEGDVDFLKQDRLLAPNIVTNPPFNLWREFAKHAHRLGACSVRAWPRRYSSARCRGQGIWLPARQLCVVHLGARPHR